MHFFSVIAQYKRADGTVGIEELGNELPSQNDFSIYEIYEIEAKNKKYYLTFGWGTHGGGHQFNIVQVFKIEQDLLTKDNSILPNKLDLIITYLRSEKSELAYDFAKNEISYREFVEDQDSGFMKVTGKKIMINLSDKNTTNPTNYIVFDGSRNKYIITENSLEYIPITPAKSSSGVYSGGEYVKKSLTADEYKSIVALLAKATANQEIQTDVRAKGNPIIEFNQKTYVLKMNAEIAQGVVKMLKDLRQTK